ncbi:MAG: hypothetical protein M1825_005691 [Sarcosagium campestre]|nr:MAG: hypothetical protein M1825_005691 [Sarcosagium campestre]
MGPSTLRLRQPVEDIECWDDDEDLQGDTFQFGTNTSTAGTNAATSFSSLPMQKRDSISSRLSTASDNDPFGAMDEERQVLIPDDNDDSTMDAIASANNAGIPIPKNVPSSALRGGTIKRLGGKRLKNVIRDDWSEDLDLPGPGQGELKIRKQDEFAFPQSIPPSNQSRPPSFDLQSFGANNTIRRGHRVVAPISPNLGSFQDGDENEDFFINGENVPTIKLGKAQPPRKAIDFSPPEATPNKAKSSEEFENDLEFPDNDEPLRLSVRRAPPKTPVNQQDEFDEWAEGSLGTRYGGTRREARSNRSSSMSAMSPSVSSSFTAESEDEGLDGLVLPEGPLHLDDILKKRQQNVSLDPTENSEGSPVVKRTAVKDDFFYGIEIGDGDVFDSGKLTLNRNIKRKAAKPTSPVRRTAMTLKFTNKPPPATSRIPRARGSQDRGQSTLEQISESGGPVPEPRVTKSRAGGHSAQSSVSSIPAPSAPSTPSATRVSMQVPTGKQRELTSRTSMKSLRSDSATTTSSQLLKMKRSMPTMNSAQSSPAKSIAGHHRPPSRTDNARAIIPSRPKTPVDRSGAESSLGNSRKPPVPFLPAGMSHSRSHHVASKSGRQTRRQESESSTASTEASVRVSSRAGARSRQAARSPSPSRRRDLAPEALAREAAAKRTLTRPARRRNFGDGSELEIFDDLPTSVNSESKFVKAPIGRGAPKAMRSKLSTQAQSVSERSETPVPSRALSPAKPEYTPRFARDTNASRIAREQRIGPGSMAPLAPVSANWRAQIASRTSDIGLNSPSASRGRRKRGNVQQKPHLIKPLGDTHQTVKSVKGMKYNPTLFRWEGNENALAPFDNIQATSKAAPPPSMAAKLEALHRPALITNVNAASPTVQVVGGMVFDPQRMCWLKLSHQNVASNYDPLCPSTVPTDPADDSDDPFAGLDDLQDESGKRDGAGSLSNANTGGKLVGEDAADEWLVGEEFDVGPEFIRRQREEEDRWRTKVVAWIEGGVGGPEREHWQWAIKDVVMGRI